MIFAVIAVALVGCGNYHLPPFAGSGNWRVVDNHAQSEHLGIDIDFGNGSTFPIANARNGQYDLNFITDDASFDNYDMVCRNYVATMLRQLPMPIDSLDFILADRYVVARTGVLTQWVPHMICNADGARLVAQAHPRSTAVQPHDELWRNFVFDKKMHRIAIVDRFVKNGRHMAIIYILQGNNRKVPFAGMCDFDIFDRCNTQAVGSMMESLLDISEAAWHTTSVPSYYDHVHTADSCFMVGDYYGASVAFERAFQVAPDINAMHLYNAACAASLAGQPDVAFGRLMQRLAMEPDWYVDDPGADPDLQPLHSDARWNSYCDSIAARRDRIEAHYNQPLRRRLLAMGESDQDIRHRYLNVLRTMPQDTALAASLLAEMQRVDADNQVAIASILDTVGFAGRDEVGNATIVYWLIIQHAPVEMQRRYFPLFMQAAARGDLSRDCVALMEDRIAMFEGRPQRYGTQIVDGKLYELDDPAAVDSLRREVGLPPIDHYLKQMLTSH